MNVFQRITVMVLTALLVSACQSVPKPPDVKSAWLDSPDYFSARSKQAIDQASWRYAAKVGIAAPQVKEQANLVWRFRDQANSVRLFGPLGVGAIKLEFDDYGVVLSDNKGLLHRGQSAEELLTSIVGWPIPIDALSSWIFVLPAKEAAFRYQLDENKQLKLLEQLGWLIEYSAYKDYNGRTMPRKIVATKKLPQSLKLNSSDAESEIVVKLITKSWK